MQVSLGSVLQAHPITSQVPIKSPEMARKDNDGDNDGGSGKDDKIGQQHLSEGSTISVLG